MLLKDKTALVFAAGGAVGSAVARRFAAEGAHVFLSGRHEDSVKALAHELDAQWEIVDATSDPDVSSYVDRVANRTHSIDVVFNGIGPRPAEAEYATPSTYLPLDAFLLPLRIIAGSQFLSARAAARHMIPQKRGAIVFLSASLTGHFIPFMAGVTAACGAVEGLARSLAAELGPHGIRVNCVRAGGMPETRTIRETTARMAETMAAAGESGAPAGIGNVMRRPLATSEMAATVTFVASDVASGIAGQVINACAGAIVSR